MSQIQVYNTGGGGGGGVTVQTLTSDAGVATAVANNINVIGGAGITTSAAGDTLTINLAGAVSAWTVVAASQGTAVDNGYIANGGALVVLTLPAVAAVGDYVRVTGLGAGLFRIAQNAGQSINFVSSTTTVGVGGSLTAIEQFDSIEMICVVANTGWTVLSSVGNFTIV